MTQADDLDKSAERQRLKEKKKERKRKQKIAQQEQNGPSAVLFSGESHLSNDISHVSSESDEESLKPLIKRPKSSHGKDTALYDEITKDVATADQKTLEEMALALLQR
jgi:hypothetical protein